MLRDTESDEVMRIERKLRTLKSELWYMASLAMFGLWLVFAANGGLISFQEAAEVYGVFVAIALVFSFLSSPILRDVLTSLAEAIQRRFSKEASNQ